MISNSISCGVVFLHLHLKSKANTHYQLACLHLLYATYISSSSQCNLRRQGELVYVHNLPIVRNRIKWQPNNINIIGLFILLKIRVKGNQCCVEENAVA